MVPKRSSLGLFGPVKWDGELSNFGLGKFQLKEMALPTWKNETSIPEGLPKSILGNATEIEHQLFGLYTWKLSPALASQCPLGLQGAVSTYPSGGAQWGGEFK